MNQWMRMVLFIIIICIPGLLFSQSEVITLDSIPNVNGRVVVAADLEYTLSKEEFNARINRFLSSQLDPVSGKIIEKNPNYTVCEIVDYIQVGDNFFHSFGVYMIYRLKFEIEQGVCHVTIDQISFLEKGYIDAYLDPSDSRDLPQYTASEIMIDRDYKQLFVKDASLRITEHSIIRINGVFQGLHALFGIEGN